MDFHDSAGIKVGYTHTHMGSFGGNSAKGMKLYGTALYIDKKVLDKKLDKTRRLDKVTSSRVASDGQKKVTGNELLKASQAYPRDFGRAIAQAHVGFSTD